MGHQLLKARLFMKIVPPMGCAYILQSVCVYSMRDEKCPTGTRMDGGYKGRCGRGAGDARQGRKQK